MRIQHAADLHLEYDDGTFALDDVGADVLVLAGDVGKGVAGIEQIAKKSKAIIVVVPGNHEFYDGRFDRVIGDIRRFCAESNGRVHYLPDGPVEIEGVRFVGTTLWTDFELQGEPDRLRAMQDALVGINDYKKIQVRADRYDENVSRPLRPSDTLQMHIAERQNLESWLAEPFDGPTVVVTHHAPSPRSRVYEYRERAKASAYASKLEGLILRYEPAVWFHGHVHLSNDYEIGPTRIMANPRGYAPDMLNPEFMPDAFIDIVPKPENTP